MIYFCTVPLHVHCRGPGGGGVLRISSDGDDRMGAKIKTPKNPWTKHKTPKNPMRNFRALKISRKDYYRFYETDAV